MEGASTVNVVCDFCGVYLGDREVEKVEGDHLTLPCRKCFSTRMKDSSPPTALENEWAILERSLERQRAEQLIHHPDASPPKIDVNMQYSAATDSWLFITPRRLTPKAFDRAKAKMHAYYTQMFADFRRTPGDRKNQNAAEEIAKALVALRENRVRNVVEPHLLDKPASF